ncbi:MAG: hypothetical protein JWP13_286 [Candidatus Saccharibacteria bacterium]|nr:hypothetical protein [Candidatus Saccharibacteria bacterium]
MSESIQGMPADPFSRIETNGILRREAIRLNIEDLLVGAEEACQGPDAVLSQTDGINIDAVASAIAEVRRELIEADVPGMDIEVQLTPALERFLRTVHGDELDEGMS